MKASRLLASVLLLGAFPAAPLHAATFLITVDTSPLQGQSGYIAFDFAAGTPTPGNTAVVSGFSFDGTLDVSAPTGDVSGSLAPGPLVLGDSQFFSEWLQGVSAFGGTLSYRLDLGVNTALGGSPDSFAFFLLDSGQTAFPTTDPTQANALFAIDLNGPTTVPAQYASSHATVSIQAAGIPEPSSLPLMLAALPLL